MGPARGIRATRLGGLALLLATLAGLVTMHTLSSETECHGGGAPMSVADAAGYATGHAMALDGKARPAGNSVAASRAPAPVRGGWMGLCVAILATAVGLLLARLVRAHVGSPPGLPASPPSRICALARAPTPVPIGLKVATNTVMRT